MPEPFHPVANSILRLSLLGGVGLSAFVLWAGYLAVRSPYEMMQEVPREQPLPFSHEHHAGGLGIDCRYCHVAVEDGPFADIPPTAVCLNCHSEMWAAAPALAPVRQSYATNLSIQWTKVYGLPQYVYFDHSIHIHKGIGCSDCHGRVDQMQLTWQAPPLTMAWCLECHRNPELHVRPLADVFKMDYRRPPEQAVLGARLVKEYQIQRLTSCTVCHR